MPSTVFLCVSTSLLPPPPPMRGRLARLSRFRIMTFSIQQAKRFYYRPGRVPLRKGPLLRAQGVLMSELLMTPQVRACRYIHYIHYLCIPIQNIIPATLYLYTLYIYMCTVCRLHLAAPPSPPPPPPPTGAAIIFCVSPSPPPKPCRVLQKPRY